MLIAFSLFVAADAPAIRLEWSATCPSRRVLVQALQTYGLAVDDRSRVIIRGEVGKHARLVLRTRDGTTTREVTVPDACDDRAAVVAVVIDALVAPYFWFAGARPASAPTRTALDLVDSTPASAPTRTALDLVDSTPASAPSHSALEFVDSTPASVPTSRPAAVPDAQPASFEASRPASDPSPSSHASVRMEKRLIPVGAYILGAIDLGTNAHTRGRVGLGFAIAVPAVVRWFVEATFLSLRSAAHASGRIDYGEGTIIAGADVGLLSGFFAGVGVGLQLVYAIASGFDTNRSAWVPGVALEARAGYRRVFSNHFELGASAYVRADFVQQRLLVDDIVVATLAPVHVGVMLTGGVTW